MSIHTEPIEYTDGDALLLGYLALDPPDGGPRPGVAVIHAWGGLDDFARGKAEALARLGYAAFALDVYGKGVLGRGPEENAGLMQPFMDDRAMLRRRLRAGLDALRGHAAVDPDRLAAIGFCFGGLAALDLARDGAPVRGVVSFHGLLQGADVPGEAIRARVLALHGWSDPLATPEQVDAFAAEMTEAGADWQLHAYGGIGHAFTNPAMQDRESGLFYDERADRRSWRAMTDFLREALAG